MSRTITRPEDIPAGTEKVRHARCGRTFRVADLENDELFDGTRLLDGAGNLCCWSCEDEECGSGYGFHPARKQRVRDALPANLATAYAPVPNALFDVGHLLGLTANARMLICALWRHQYGGRAYPPHDQLARETGLSVATIKRTIRQLEDLALLDVRRTRRGGRQLPNEYDLTPLWEALEAAAAGRHPTVRDRAAGPPEAAATSPTGAQSELRPELTVTPGPELTVSYQVEPEQVEPEQVEPADAGSGVRPTSPTTNIDEDDHAQDDARSSSLCSECGAEPHRAWCGTDDNRPLSPWYAQYALPPATGAA